MSRRDDLIATATRMFRERGYRATGIDSILAETGAAKATLYSQFRSKSALTVAVLESEERRFHTDLHNALSAVDAPGERILAVFDFAESWFGRSDFNGCMFVNAAVELAGSDDAIQTVVTTHNTAMREVFRAELAREGAEDAESTAAQLQLLFEGAIVVAQVTGDASVARTARDAAARLIGAPQAEAPTRKAASLVRALMKASDD